MGASIAADVFMQSGLKGYNMEVYLPCSIEEGLFPTERTASFVDRDGNFMEIIIDESFVKDDAIRVNLIERTINAVLVEFPAECTNGAWRAWIAKESFIVD